MKGLQYLFVLIFFSSMNAQVENEFIQLPQDDPLHILLADLKDKSLYPPQNLEEWSSAQLIKQLFADYEYDQALKTYKENFGSVWSQTEATYYGLYAASKIDSVDWFWKVYQDCPDKVKEQWEYKDWHPEIIQRLGTEKYLDSVKIAKNKNLDIALNDLLTLIMLEDISIRTSGGQMQPPQWVMKIIEEDGLSHLLPKIRALPFPELAKSHWQQLDSLLTEKPELDLENIGFLAKTGLEMSLLHVNPSKLPKHYKFIKENIRPDLIGYFVDKALLKRELPQIFATQVDRDQTRKVFTWLPVYDMERADEFRMKIGMSPLKQYAKLCNLDYEREVEFHLEKVKDK